MMNARLAARLLQALSRSPAAGISADQIAVHAHAQSLAPAVQRSLHVSSSLWLAQAQPAERERDAAPKASGEESSGGEAGPHAQINDDSAAGGERASTSSSDEQQQGEASSHGSRRFDAQTMLNTLAKDLKETLSPVDGLRSYTRKYRGPVMEAPEGPYTGTSAISVVKQQQTTWQKAWGLLSDRFGHLPFVSKLSGFKVQDTPAYQKGQAFVDDLKEKYETSDHPMVHKVEEYKERVFAGSEASQAMHEIRIRDPGFDMNLFLRSIKLDAPVVTKAFLKHDMEALSDHCGPEIMQRLEGLCAVLKQQELHEDPTILFVGDVEVVEVRMMDNDPFIICQFHCQQLKCVRDKFGNVVEGSPDTIHRVYYFWGLQQEKEGVVTADGELLPPRWVIKDMLWQSMLALV